MKILENAYLLYFSSNFHDLYDRVIVAMHRILLALILMIFTTVWSCLLRAYLALIGCVSMLDDWV